MKCIKATKTTKQFKTGDIKRVTDNEAASSTADGYWMYISKSEWKSSNRKPVEVVNEQITDAVTVSEKQLKSKKKSK
jgi:hypothetical protein